MLIETIIDGLGYSKTDVIKEFSCPNYKQGKIDYIIKNEGKIVLAIEAKAVGKNLDEYREQIDDYSRSPELDDAKVAILTNGYEWRIFIREKKGEQSHFNFDKPSKFILTERPTYDTICNFHKGFSIENILTQAQTKQFKKKIKNYFNIIFDEDSENCEYIRKIFNSIRDGDADFLKGIVINKNVVNSRRDNFIEAFEEFLVERAEKEKKQKKLEKQKEEELKKNEQQKDEEKTETTTHNPPKTVEEFE